MKHSNSLKKLAGIGLFCMIAASSIAWQSNGTHSPQTWNDTTPERHRKVRDIDDAIEQLDKGQAEVDQSMHSMDLKQMQKDLQASLREMQINTAKMQAEIRASMETLRSQDWQKAAEEARVGIEDARRELQQNSELKQEDLHKIQDELDRALKAVDIKKIQASTEQALAQVDMEKVNAAMEKAKQIDMEKIQQSFEHIQPEIERSMAKAHEGIARARKELDNYRGLIDALDKDGLIHKDQNYTIEYKQGDLIINGTKQPDNVKERYQSFLKGQRNFTLEKNEDGFDIRNGRHED